MTNWQLAVTPDGPTGQEWAKAELDKLAYQSYENPLVRPIYDLLKWIESFLKVGRSNTHIPTPIIIIAIALAVVIVVALIIKPYVLKNKSQSKVVFDSEVSVQHLEETLSEALLRSDWETAVITQFRLIVKHLEAADFIVDSPGLTALEVAQTTTALMPLLSTPMYRAAGIFNDVRYGGLPATEEMFQLIAEVAQNLPDRISEVVKV